MRGTLAKALRRLVYGDQSLREKRVYRMLAGGTIVSTGLRRKYQVLKRGGIRPA